MMIRVFIGTDRSQKLATLVLSHSLRSTTKNDIAIEPLDKIKIPEPEDVRQSQRTGFSFARWAIPELCDYKGKAIYLDADMLVFSDIAHLWNVPMGDASISILNGTNANNCSNSVKLNKNESSVMIINCEKANWNLHDLVKGLDHSYTYKEMMSDLCFLEEKQISRNLSRSWNSMDYWDNKVDLVHFTNVPTQPWVSLDNPFGYVWVDYLKMMIKESYISLEEIMNEVELGYVRPSLLIEIEKNTAHASDVNYINELKKIDEQANFVPHREVMAWNLRRNKAIKAYERTVAKQNGYLNYLSFQFKAASRVIIDRLRSI